MFKTISWSGNWARGFGVGRVGVISGLNRVDVIAERCVETKGYFWAAVDLAMS